MSFLVNKHNYSYLKNLMLLRSHNRADLRCS